MPRKPTPQPCACGCGEMTAGYWDYKAKRCALYKQGHHPSHNPPLQKIPLDVLLEDARRVEQITGRVLNTSDLKNFGHYCPNTYFSNFGGFVGLLKALGHSICLDWSIENLSPIDGNWIAGLVDGEGCFRVAKIKREASITFAPSFYVGLRSDDASVLKQIRQLLSLKTTLNYDKQRNSKQNAKPRTILYVFNTEELFHIIVPTFQTYRLRSKKYADFAIFASAVKIKHARRLQTGKLHPPYSDEERALLEKHYLAAKKIKQYKVTLDEVLAEFRITLNP